MRKIILLIFIAFLSIKTANASINFDSANTKIDCGSASSLDNLSTQGGGGMTLSAWIRPISTGEGGSGDIVNKANIYDGRDWEFYTRANFGGGGQTIGFYVMCSGTDIDVVAGNNSISLSAWQHILVTWTGSLTANTVHIYVNGVETSYASQTNGTVAIGDDSTLSMIIGNNAAGSETFDGGISEVAVWNTVLTANDAKVLNSRVKGTPLQVKPSNLKGYWPLDDCQNNTGCTNNLIDRSGNGNNATSLSAVGAGEKVLSYQ